MKGPIPIQDIIGGVAWEDYTRTVVEALSPGDAASLANTLRAGIKVSGIKKINPEDHPDKVDTILGNLGLLEARARQ